MSAEKINATQLIPKPMTNTTLRSFIGNPWWWNRYKTHLASSFSFAGVLARHGFPCQEFARYEVPWSTACAIALQIPKNEIVKYGQQLTEIEVISTFEKLLCITLTLLTLITVGSLVGLCMVGLSFESPLFPWEIMLWINSYYSVFEGGYQRAPLV